MSDLTPGQGLLVIFIALLVGIIIGVLFWGFLFMFVDWVFPGAIYALVPEALQHYSPFSLGAFFAFIAFAIRSILRGGVQVSAK